MTPMTTKNYKWWPRTCYLLYYSSSSVDNVTRHIVTYRLIKENVVKNLGVVWAGLFIRLDQCRAKKLSKPTIEIWTELKYTLIICSIINIFNDLKQKMDNYLKMSLLLIYWNVDPFRTAIFWLETVRFVARHTPIKNTYKSQLKCSHLLF